MTSLRVVRGTKVTLKYLPFQFVGFMSNFFYLFIVFSPFYHHAVVFLLEPLNRLLTSEFFIFGMHLGLLEFHFSMRELIIEPLKYLVSPATRNGARGLTSCLVCSSLFSILFASRRSLSWLRAFRDASRDSSSRSMV